MWVNEWSSENHRSLCASPLSRSPFNLFVISAYASSHEISFHRGSTPIPFLGFVRLKGFCMRSLSYRVAMPAFPLGHIHVPSFSTFSKKSVEILEKLFGLYGLGSILTSLPLTTRQTIPDCQPHILQQE